MADLSRLVLLGTRPLFFFPSYDIYSLGVCLCLYVGATFINAALLTHSNQFKAGTTPDYLPKIPPDYHFSNVNEIFGTSQWYLTSQVLV